MARIRSIKPEFFTDPDIAQLEPRARLLFIAMWCAADDFGVGETNTHALLGLAFPETDEISAPLLRHFCADIAQHLRVRFYKVRGRRYYAIESWSEHQKFETREDRRKHPPPDHPDACPDLQILDRADSAPLLRETSGAKSALEQGTGNREQGTEEPPLPPQPEPAPPERITQRDGRGTALARMRDTNTTARSPEAYRIAEAFSASLPVPIESGLLSGIGVQIDKCVQRGIPPPAIANGLRAWTASDSWSPTQIPNFVHKANNSHTCQPPRGAELKAAQFQALKAEFTDTS